MPSADIAIRAKRKLTNRLIAAHDAGRLRPHMTDDMLLIVGDGTLIQGADAVVAAFANQFADKDFIAYGRTSETVEIADNGHRAAETGRWVGRWRGGVEASGVYMAARKPWPMAARARTLRHLGTPAENVCASERRCAPASGARLTLL